MRNLFYILLVVLTGYAQAGSIWSIYDKGYFSETPYIFIKNDQYSLRWKYGTWGFAFYPTSKITPDGLAFFLEATTSSGNRTNKMGEIFLTDAKLIQVLLKDGAYWMEPNGQKVPLEIKKSE